MFDVQSLDKNHEHFYSRRKSQIVLKDTIKITNDTKNVKSKFEKPLAAFNTKTTLILTILVLYEQYWK